MSEMIRIVLINDVEMQTVVLPDNIEGRYAFYVSGSNRELASIEGNKDRWIVKCHDNASFVYNDGSNMVKFDSVIIKEDIDVVILHDNKKYNFFTEKYDTRAVFFPYTIHENTSITIGRSPDNDIYIPELHKLSRHHAKLINNENKWSIQDTDSTNGVYVNGKKIDKVGLKAGDIVYCMGLTIIVGTGFFSIKNINEKVNINDVNVRRITSDSNIYSYRYRRKNGEYFNRVVRPNRILETEPIKVEMPPMMMNGDKMPLLLRMGSQLMMGGTSLAMGNIMGAANSMIMPGIMQGYTEKEKKEYEAKRRTVYMDYLNLKQQEIDKEKAREESVLKELYPTLLTMCDMMTTKDRLWERRKFDQDFLSIRVGTGNIPLVADIEYNKMGLQIEPDYLIDEMNKFVEKKVYLDSVPVMLELKKDYIVGIEGGSEQKNQLINNIIYQTVFTHSYDEVKIVMLVDEADNDDFQYVKYLQHNWNDSKNVRYYCDSVSDALTISKLLNDQLEKITERNSDKIRYDKRMPSYLIIATSKELYDRVEALVRIQDNEDYAGFSIIAAFDGMPKECQKIIRCQHYDNCQLIDMVTVNSEILDFRRERCEQEKVEAAVEEMLATKLLLAEEKYSLPTMLTFLELFGAGKVEHLNPLQRWKESNPIKTLAAPIGIGTDGKKFMLDLHEKFHGPHGLIAGGTGSGKSEFIITYILSMAVNYSPDEVSFILIDYKGGGLADAFVNEKKGIHLPHVVGTITNLDGAAISRSLMSINSELKRRQRLFKEAKTNTDEGTIDIYDYQKMYRNGIVKEPLPHLIIVSDEFAELKKQQPEFMDELISTARIGRSLGVHLILATQKPSGVVNDQIWSNSKFRICLRVADKSDSMEMLKRPEAAEIKNTGRFYLQVGYNELFAMGQSAWCGADYAPNDTWTEDKKQSVIFLDNTGHTVIEEKVQKKVSNSIGKQIVSIVNYLSDIAKEEGIVPKQLWCDPLPDRLDYDTLEESVASRVDGDYKAIIGQIDDPKNQNTFPYELDFLTFRNMYLCGNSGSGKSTFLKTMLYSMINRYSPDEFNYYIADFPGGALRAFANVSHCGAYLTEENANDFFRLLDLIKGIISERKKLFEKEDVSNYEAYIKLHKLPLILVVVDGYTIIKDKLDGGMLYMNFHEYIRESGAYGIRYILTVNHMNEIHTKTRQEVDYKVALQANDKYVYNDILDAKTEFVIPEKAGRGMCLLNGSTYEYHVAITDAGLEEQLRGVKLKERLEKINAKYPSSKAVKKLPMIDGTDTYEEFCSQFDKDVFPIGYNIQNMKKVSLPFKQFLRVPVYLGNPLGVKPFFENIMTFARHNEMKTIIMKRSVGSVFESYADVKGIECSDAMVLETSETDYNTLFESICREMEHRNTYITDYCERYGIPATASRKAAKAYKCIRENTKPVLVVLESVADICRLPGTEVKSALDAQFVNGFFKIIKGYNIFFVGGFYPSDSDVRSSSYVEAFCSDMTSLLLGGCYDRQVVLKGTPSEFYKLSKVESKYDLLYMKYRDELYKLRMPCGELVQSEADPEDMSII